MRGSKGLALVLSVLTGALAFASAGCVSARQTTPVVTTPVQATPVRPQVRPPLRPRQQRPPPAPQILPPPPPIVLRAAPPPQASLWPGGVVPMCFTDPDPDDGWARRQIRAAAATWEAQADLHFDIAEACGEPGRVPIRIVRDPEMFASSSHLGNSLRDGGEIVLNAEYLVTNRLCGPRGVIGEQRCFYADALHELGHALGFSHDHVSANAPNCLARTTTPEAIDAGETYYDPISIMNYCNANRFYGFLSAADTCSVRAAYGVVDGDRPRRSDCYALVNAAYPGG